ncbi:MAG: PEP-CTERM-box response regulator transcription factor [Thermodesulfobacteriota bacterium]|jgi:two-component system NtrC family response regulator
MDNPKLLIVEDDEELRTQMKWALVRDYEVFLANDRPNALEILRSERPAVVTLDLGLPPHPEGVEEGFLALADMLEQDSLAKVIIITGQGEKDNALKAIGQGAYDFFCKPIQIDELKVVLSRAFHLSRLEMENRELQQKVTGEAFDKMLGTSPKMQEVFAAIRKVATTEVPVLITGESGTGKELVARAIHRESSKKDGPFVVINCGAIPENLLESELFGHEKGSFTGAHIQRKGRIEAAHGGTLFLDEIGELSLPLQVKLLRFLQEQRIERVGGREEIVVEARVLTATNMDLKQGISDGRFREDLYYRIEVVSIDLPPLRKREGDILLLANAFLRKYVAENKKKITGFTKQALREIEVYGWPGNIRELENRIKRAVIMAEGSRITPMDLELTSSHAKYEGKSLKEARDAMERDLVKRAISRNKGNLTKAAEELGLSRPTLYEMMEKLGIGKEG